MLEDCHVQYCNFVTFYVSRSQQNSVGSEQDQRRIGSDNEGTITAKI